MNLEQTKSILIERVDGGFLIDWREPEKAPRTAWGTLPEVPRPKTSGREIITDERKLVKRVRDFFGIKP